MAEITRYKNRDGRDKSNLADERNAAKPKGPRDYPRRKKNQKKPIKPSTFERERKYASIKLAKSGRSLSEIKSFMKTGTAHLTDEYSSPTDLNALSQLAYGLNYISLTRGQAKEILKLRFNKKPKMFPNREEYIANFLIGGKIPINWERDGNLIRKGPPNDSQPGSSKGKMATTIKGAQKTNKNFQRLIRSLQDLIRRGQKGAGKNLNDLSKQIKKAVKIN